ncbi:hypothetical protein F7725_001654 [Dissostichus mawsoni]|uniref:Uncharacterized protein n=1 Tax=Dissostichus mawsoni TaxID=36200 RepID=A0A7J5Y077_DISMA|nr:hypothetical protein F7725_001654 [Dissostichus mawsoni]
MYLSYESLLSLLPVNFPSDDVAGGPKDRRSPDTADTPDQPLSVNATRSTNGGCGIARRPADRPRDSAMGASPPAPADEASPDLTVPTGAFLGAPLTVPQSPPALPQPTRPGRSRRVSVRSGRNLLLLSAAAAREFLESQSECSRITADLCLH